MVALHGRIRGGKHAAVSQAAGIETARFRVSFRWSWDPRAEPGLRTRPGASKGPCACRPAPLSNLPPNRLPSPSLFH